MRHIFIINPAAGNGRYQNDLADLINSELLDKDIEYEIYLSRFKGDIHSYLLKKCNDKIESVIYACGGDGTLHEVINATHNVPHVSIGVIPRGSGNDFIKNFSKGTHFNDINFQIHGSSVNLDLIKVNNKYAASVCTVGLDADAAFQMHKFKKIPFINGSTRYYLAVIYCLINKLGNHLEISVDGSGATNSSYLLTVMANGQFYGGGYKCAPLAILNDGLMDLCLVKNISRFKILNLMNSYKAGTHLENPKLSKWISYKKCKKIKIKSSKPLNVCVDGEIYLHNEVALEIEKDAFKFWMPKEVQIIGSKKTAKNK
ncbi:MULTISPECIES: diacylglycerol/lipid kinase family protein [unclassified Sedimentibacter]|uniref:diacylglycerol/lipid kinase family protein n=1 Tax=unclassified Sedimentibacter TaxID=2649220 RepID=UPI0027E02596|nr:YegS/Rv2252/BmrU family lipid kinase [Sedimentibacter sp. MB35-C1]WMJ76581.1 YegS/Rv2252/BmrU family lipid kinase [Sedimentibacter sp. MB35-C1]